MDWKTANVCPIVKKGSKSSPSNYRPVSLTCIVCKVLESIIKDEIFKHLLCNDMLLSSQHGFQSGRSCLSNLLEFLDDVSKLRDEGNSVDVIYLDFSKAFDKVPHDKLLIKVEALGIRGQILAWVRDYLADRKQRVVINGEQSEFADVTSGVPQGSVLGPVLFLIYINDLDVGLSCNIKKFADDTKIYGQVNNEADCRKLQDDLDRLISWSVRWGMEFNVEKCKYLRISKRGQSDIGNLYTMLDRQLTKVSKKGIWVFVLVQI